MDSLFHCRTCAGYSCSFHQLFASTGVHISTRAISLLSRSCFTLVHSPGVSLFCLAPLSYTGYTFGFVLSHHVLGARSVCTLLLALYCMDLYALCGLYI